MFMKLLKNKKAQSVMEYSMIFILVSIPLAMIFLDLRTAITTKSINTMNILASDKHINSNAQFFSQPK